MSSFWIEYTIKSSSLTIISKAFAKTKQYVNFFYRRIFSLFIWEKILNQSINRSETATNSKKQIRRNSKKQIWRNSKKFEEEEVQKLNIEPATKENVLFLYVLFLYSLKKLFDIINNLSRSIDFLDDDDESNNKNKKQQQSTTRNGFPAALLPSVNVCENSRKAKRKRTKFYYVYVVVPGQH